MFFCISSSASFIFSLATSPLPCLGLPAAFFFLRVFPTLFLGFFKGRVRENTNCLPIPFHVMWPSLLPVLSLQGSSCLIGKNFLPLCTQSRPSTYNFLGLLFLAYTKFFSAIDFTVRAHRCFSSTLYTSPVIYSSSSQVRTWKTGVSFPFTSTPMNPSLPSFPAKSAFLLHILPTSCSTHRRPMSYRWVLQPLHSCHDRAAMLG